MRFEHPGLPGRWLHLGYCLNLHAAEDFEGVLRGMRQITLPLRDRLLGETGRFGVGMYFPAQIAGHLVSAKGQADLEELISFLDRERLDAFTFNAFPFGNFHKAGLKRDVFSPTWCEDERLEYTLAVAELASRIHPGRPGQISISTHPGRFGPWEAGEFDQAVDRLAQLIEGLARLEASGGPRVRLAMEAEPRAVAGDTRSMGAQLEQLEEALAPRVGRDLVRAHLGACLDSCHAAVEFESVRESVQAACVLPLGKLQVSSAIVLKDPGAAAAARAALFDLDEPRYLHQTTGLRAGELLRVDDLPELEAACAEPNSPWLACEEWRTHFHVPIDLEALGASGLETTAAHGMATMAALLEQPERWGGDELHVEIETYTWDILPGEARTHGGLLDGLEREYGAALEQLESSGWRLATGGQ